MKLLRGDRDFASWSIVLNLQSNVLSEYFAIADYEGEVRQKFEKTLLRVGKLREMGMPEEEITQDE